MWVVFALAVLLGAYLVWVGGWPIIVIGILAIAAAIAYTVPLPPWLSRAWRGFSLYFFWAGGSLWHILCPGFRADHSGLVGLTANGVFDIGSFGSK